ncbi:MAG: SufS family cysteine desulfurase [Alphaproteobacteria bacterium]|nr:SufS family cysteine desulfurase [Alphaproteobacteria bacterium]
MGNMALDTQQSKAAWDVEAIREEFPILSRTVKHGKPLTYFDNAASKQKPNTVLDAMDDAHCRYYANVHRGAHLLSGEATDAFEAARRNVQQFIHARHDHEIIFVRGTTEAINLVASSFGRNHLKAGDVVLLSQAEHHSNIVPWQLLREQVAIRIIPVPLMDDGRMDMAAYEYLLKKENVKLCALSHASNAMGVVNDAAKMVRLAHEYGAKILLDGCQATAHLTVDVQALDVDFYAFSAHKMYGPSGIGALYGKEALLETMPPYQGGGEMIDHVTFAQSTWARLPMKFEAGTPAIVDAIGFGAAVEFLNGIDRVAAHAHEQNLLRYLMQELNVLGGVQVFGAAQDKLAIVSFNLEGIHHNDVASLVDNEGVALRAGHHCAQPLMDYLGVAGTCRASLCFYNTIEEVDRMIAALVTVREIFG